MYAVADNIESVIKQLESESKSLLSWLANNALKANPDKSHLILNNRNNEIFALIDNYEIFNCDSEKLLGINMNNELNFNKHVSSLCKKASQKLHALSRLSKYMSLEQRRKIMNAFIESQFGDCR